MKRCVRCNTDKPLAEFSKRLGSTNAACKSCINKAAAIYRDANRAAIRKSCRRYHHANKASRTAKHRAWRDANADRIKENSRAYTAANKETLAEKSRRWYEKNREYAKAQAKKWREDHPEQVRATLSDLRVKRNRAEGSHSASDIRSLHAHQDGLCAGCKNPLDSKYHVDHVIPLSKGGTNWPDNLQILCCTCNRRKGRKLPHQWELLRTLLQNGSIVSDSA